MANKAKKTSIWTKAYLIILFLCGIGIWFSMQSVQKRRISMDVLLDKRIVDVLVANGVVQNDILTQYIRERTKKTSKWNEFYKTIKLKTGNNTQSFETSFKSVARSMKIGLSKTNNLDGSITYKFYSPNRNYYNITLINYKKFITN
ncbi:MAG: hypothetical protein LBS81_03130 [Endomicrobium sp.]|nr:hypothetical protein [Endomicrobium sp.]